MTTPDVRLLPMADPRAIETASLAIIDSEVPEPRPFQGVEWRIARRMIHTTADFDLLNHLVFHPEAVSAGLDALRRGCLIFTDTDMARCGIPTRRTDPLGCVVRCLMSDPATAAKAAAEGTTRAQAAVDLAWPEADGAIFVIGNAPTALLRVLRHLADTPIRPALIIGMPVGFVNAAESKELLLSAAIPHITLRGRKGGSPLAACVVNALAEEIRAGEDGKGTV